MQECRVTCGMAGQSAHSNTSSVSVAPRLAKPGGSSSGANCLDPTRSSLRRRSDGSSVMGTGITSPKLRGDKKLKLHTSRRKCMKVKPHKDKSRTRRY